MRSIFYNSRLEESAVDVEKASLEFLVSDGAAMRNRKTSPTYTGRLREAVKLYGRVLNGNLPLRWLQEAMTTSDFQILFGDIIDRQVLANYAEAPQTWPAVAKRSTVADFRPVKRITVDGAEQPLDEVEERAPYPETKLDLGDYLYSVKKHGRVAQFSWETMVNDDLDALRDIPRRFGRAARRSEEKFVTGMFVGPNGPNATFYSSGNKNIVNATNANGGVSGPFTVDNPPLTIAGLQQAMSVLLQQKDTGGDPIDIDAVTLVVTPANQITALNIMNSLQVVSPGYGATADPLFSGATRDQGLLIQNWMREKVSLAVMRYIPMIATSANGNKSWFLFANPSVGRPAMEIGFLRGHEAPELFMKSPNSVSLSGAGAGTMDGDFETDSLAYKIRHVFGGTLLDPKASVASNGSGS